MAVIFVFIGITKAGFVGPVIKRVGVFVHAAKCAGPVSFETIHFALSSINGNSTRSILLHKLIMCSSSCEILRHSVSSSGPPIRIIFSENFFINRDSSK